MPSLGSRLASLFAGDGGDAERVYDRLEEVLIEGDFGAFGAVELVDGLRKLRIDGIRDAKQLSDGLRGLIRPSLHTAKLSPDSERLSLYLILGINGVGKTLTAGSWPIALNRRDVKE